MSNKKRYSRKTTGITISIFYEQYQLGKYNFEALYQRDYNVWDSKQKSFLIDTIMKNFPIPPIFLEQKIDSISGKTTYDVIDGKQRLTTIIDFIENKVKVPNDFGKDIYGDNRLNEKSFIEIQEIASENEEIRDFVSDFWGYVINIEYIENPGDKIVDNIFDRLNRGGERLNPQELRKANYYDSIMYESIESLRKCDFLSSLLETLDKNRLEDVSFITELYLLIITNEIIDGVESAIDKSFTVYVDEVDEEKAKSIICEFEEIIKIVQTLGLDYDKYRIRGVSHLYALFYFAYYIRKNNIPVDDELKEKLTDFYIELRGARQETNVVEYHKSMQSASKYKHSRKKRINSLLSYFGFPTV